MKKRLNIFSVLTMMVLILAACGGNEVGTNTSSEGNAEGKLVIGFSQPTLESPFYTALVEGAKEEASKLGAELIVVDAQNDIEKQNSDIQSLITKGIDVLLINPVNPSGVAPSLKAAEQANIPVIAVDRNTKQEVASYIGRDNEEMGREAGKKAVELLGGEGKATGKIIEIQGDAGGTVMQARHDGFHEIVEKESGIEIIEGPYSNYIRAEAVSAMQDLLQAHSDVNLVYAHNDDMALGAIQVLEKSGKLQDVSIVGIDGLMEAIKQIKAGKFKATVINDPISLGVLSIQTAVKIGKGETVEKYVDGGTGLIDETNVDQYLDETKKFAEIK
ncbi:substrate-binding domain-containing protein [Ureibacillus chungkukjangi]|uniref:Monosaccharide ABC transporter substrate-binding protein (CUT2 family) n=1 Tax=Ureibacillus chungkukjangi TaxID=1202712 RepID=A0A318TUN9_9BACL|nr:substrate-binding domain-containing protein [Ureibacillus chungkukjangi]PYF05625.1 monosaccharide ABC transporter substrate-binding protein (CUT2 family) [Ureibacillus chungkukjangi]